MKVDVVYTVGRACEIPNYWELRMSLRSLSFFQDLGNVFIVGEKPSWCHNVIHVPATDPYTHNKDANLINKLVLACMHPELSDEFLWFSDDQYLLRECNAEDVRDPRLSNQHIQSNPKDKWHKRVARTVRVLKAHRLPSNCYEAHCPYLINKHLYPRHVFRFDYGDKIGYCSNTLYFNSTQNPLGHNRTTVAEIPVSVDRSTFDVMTMDKLFMSINRKMTDNMKGWMEELYPTASSYESDAQ